MYRPNRRQLIASAIGSLAAYAVAQEPAIPDKSPMILHNDRPEDLMSSAALEHRLTEIREMPNSRWEWFATVDHKTIGIRYLVTAITFLRGSIALFIALPYAEELFRCWRAQSKELVGSETAECSPKLFGEAIYV